jgi:uncharacterized protein (DUF302 family)
MADVHYGFSTRLNVPYEAAIEKVTAALKEQGFGVLTQIDVRETLKQKLGVDHRRYIILGACNPPLAYRALQAEPEIGLLLPCNVIVYEGEGEEESVVSIVDPLAMMQVSANAALAEIAAEAQARLKKVVAALA